MGVAVPAGWPRSCHLPDALLAAPGHRHGHRHAGTREGPWAAAIGRESSVGVGGTGLAAPRDGAHLWGLTGGLQRSAGCPLLVMALVFPIRGGACKRRLFCPGRRGFAAWLPANLCPGREPLAQHRAQGCALPMKCPFAWHHPGP